MRVRVWLSLGSNMDREYNIRSAITALEKVFGRLIISPVYESDAVGFTGDPFLNLVVGVETDWTPQQLVALLRSIEHSHGRERSGEKFSARTLDIDLLTYGHQVLHAPGIDLPRKEITRYAFVLQPLAKVAGNELHPVLGVSYAALWRAFDKSRQSLREVELRFD